MKPECFLFVRRNGGGNIPPAPTKTIRRKAAIGDAIACTIVADKLLEQNFKVEFQTLGMIQPVIRRHPGIGSVSDPVGNCDVVLDGAYEKDLHRRLRHFYAIFMDVARKQLLQQGIDIGPSINCRPRLTPHKPAQEALRAKLQEYPRPWVFICPRSNSYKVRQIPDGIWREAADGIQGTKFWIGTFPGPQNIVDLQCHDLRVLTDYLSIADLLITVDTGPMHIANAVGTQVLAIAQSSSPELHLSDQTDFRTIGPSLDCLNCQLNLCPKSQWLPPCQQVPPGLIAREANRSLRRLSETVSAVIPIFKPSGEMLNKCLAAVLPQVDEVVVTKERGGIFPADMIRNPKIITVTKDQDGIGFGRNVNFGARHSTGKYLLVLNDDVYLNPDAVSQMMKCMKPDVGIVGQLLWYPNRTIYHAGKVRQPGQGIGFPHADLRKTTFTIKEPIEMENTNGASILFRREAFYDADGYDDGFQFYAEDDDICMKVRLRGWKLWYTPHAQGVHDEHAETKKVPGIWSVMGQSNARFGQKWGAYFRHNAGNTGLGNFDYMTHACV